MSRGRCRSSWNSLTYRDCLSVQRDGQDDDRKLKRRVAAKFAEGDVAGAVREISYPESISPNCRETLELLKRKYPPAPED